MKIEPILDSINQDTFIEDYLTACGIEDVDSFINPKKDISDNPSDYLNMDKAIERIHQAILNKEKIGILQDCDGDGVMSTTIAYDFLRKQGIQPIVFFHIGKQHGIKSSKEEKIINEVVKNKINLLWIPDAGSGDSEECARLKQKGIDVVVTDHHLFFGNESAIVVNCHYQENTNHDTTGAGVTYKLVKEYGRIYNVPISNYDDLVSLSLISDVMDMRNLENRSLVNNAFSHKCTNEFLGYLQEKLCAGQQLNSNSIAWDIAPKINAVQRNSDIEAKRKLLLAFAGEYDFKEALSVAKSYHSQQSNKTKKIMEALEPTLDLSHKVIIGFGNVEDANYLGLVANKIMGKYKKPTFILREANSTTWSGSMRSPVGIASLINDTKLAECAGHEEASGFVIKKSKLNKFIKWCDTLDMDFDPAIKVAGLINCDNDIRVSFVENINKYSLMWGKKIEKPVFATTIKVKPDEVNVYRKRTITIKIKHKDMEFMLFRAKESDVENIANGGEITLIFSLDLNEWEGNIKVQGLVSQYEINPIFEENQENWEDLW